MSNYAFDWPDGREVVAEPSEYPFYAQYPTATPRFVEFAEERFERRDPSELDFSRYRKVRDLARGGYYRPFGMTEITGAEAAGVTAFCVVGGQLILLVTPGAEKVESEHLGVMVGREASPDEPLGTLTSWAMQLAGRRQR
jgi:hypothetical protein